MLQPRASMSGAFRVPDDDLLASHCQFIRCLSLGLVGQGSADALPRSVRVSGPSFQFSVQKLLQRKELCGLSGTQGVSRAARGVGCFKSLCP